AIALLGRAYRLAGDLPAAETHLTQALITLERVQPDHLTTAEAWIDLALVRLAQERIEEASTLLQQAQAIYQAMLKPDNPNMAPLLNALGELALAQGDGATAHTYFAQVHDLLTDKVAPTHVDLVQALRRLA
ncbi:MAG: tetratricopeptide repeat protein, partial [Anaerolineales bacterium]|nr:tetratricopeptide repeat protein [Anaerolineales bacterium]